ncbi:DUF927 domain-containing protein [Methylocystis heyeri]|uniref:DUF927 domain-containing protein n=1 Tax=Methylocystis heyeri TaxID=391905 RepID=A0A6B8KEM2_9HYPH|nr:DUF927 domain-containing protein [Methylocystis heyeri]QGM46137.1 DUF927 domain-containing protein [Methylocystis heyeri]
MAEGAQLYLERVLPLDGEHFVGVFNKENGKGAFGYPGLTADEALKVVRRFRQRPGNNVYVSLASQKGYDERQSSKTGQAFKSAKRTLETFAKSKCLYMDIDVKEKGYPSQEVAIAALYEAVDNYQLPRPTVIVGSGSGGIHAYWVLDALLDYMEWRSLSEALIDWADRAGIKFDRGVTIDGVRILRVPGTMNNKPGVNKPVTIIYLEEQDIALQDMHNALAPYKRAGVADRVREALGIGNADVLGGNYFQAAGLRDIDKVAVECPWISNQLATGGVGRDNPQWSQAVLVASFCENPEATAHRLSNGHAQYTDTETQAEITRRLKERDEGTHRVGFPSCHAIRDTGADECQTCPHFELETSPLKLGDTIAMPPEAPLPEAVRQAEEEVKRDYSLETIALKLNPFLPAGGRVNPQTGIVTAERTSENDDGDAETKRINVFKGVIFEAWISRGTDGLIFNFMTTIGGKPTQGSVSVKEAGGSSPRGPLAGQGLFLSEGKDTEAFMRDWLHNLKTAAETVITGVPFGWHTMGDKDKADAPLGFSYAGLQYSTKNPGLAPRPSEELVKQYYPAGVIEPWKDAAAAIIADNCQDRAVIIASAFAAPLMRFTGEGGVALGTFSPESGLGKSTALKIAQAVWGHPRRGLQGLDDTMNATIQKAAELNSLPVYYDELKTHDEVTNFTSTLFRLTSGKGKARLSAAAKQQETPTWDTMLVYASNDTIVAALTETTKGTVAGNVRVFEYQTRPFAPSITPSAMAQKISQLETNYGRAGEVYAKFLGANAASVRAQVAERMNSFADKLGATGEERFWVSAMVITLAGAAYANQLGLTKFNLPSMRAFLTDEFDRMRAARKIAANDLMNIQSIITIMSEFLADMASRRTIHTDQINLKARGRPKPLKLFEDPQRVDRLGVQIKYETAPGDRGIILIDESELEKWLGQKRIPITVFLTSAGNLLRADRSVGALGTGTRLAISNVRVFKIDTAEMSAEPFRKFCRDPEKPI